jgi:hypothetical protein
MSYDALDKNFPSTNPFEFQESGEENFTGFDGFFRR